MRAGPGTLDRLLLSGPGEPQEDANGSWLAVLELLVPECREPQEDPMMPGWWCWSCCYWDLGIRGVAPMLPGWWGCSQQLLPEHSPCHGVFWAVCRFLVRVAAVIVLARGQAQWGWSSCCGQALERCGRAVMPPGWRCWGCSSPAWRSFRASPVTAGCGCWCNCFPLPVSCGKTPVIPGWLIWGHWYQVLGSCGKAPTLSG